MSAIISACGRYRYKLGREGDPASNKKPLPFVMLNPSTADAEKDDPTIRRCRGFAKELGYNGIVVVNLYALRSTKPAGLWEHHDPVGPINDDWLHMTARAADVIVCAWGANAKPARVERAVAVLTRNGARLMCLGTNKKDGSPRHPLYVRGDQPLLDWPQITLDV